MGSLPNLQALSDDPCVPYKYVLREPEDLPKRNYGPAVAAFNSQHYVDRCRVDLRARDQKLDQLLSETRAGLQCQKGMRHHRVRQTRSTGSNNNPCLVGPSWEDYLLELQMTMTSPQSARSSRSNVMFAVNQSVRRRDSLTSSGGTSSVRRLIAVVRSTPSRLGPVYSRRVLCRNFAALCLGHVTITAALLPLLSLQSSVSTWYYGSGEGPGANLLAATFALASLSSLISPYIIHFFGCKWTLVLGYVGESLFFASHLYPVFEWLVPGYIIMGFCLGPLACARSTFVVTLAGKLTYVLSEEEEVQDTLHGDIKESLLRKLARGLQMSQDIGMALGNLVAWLFLHYSWSADDEDKKLRALFIEEQGDLICGAPACPLFKGTYDDGNNNTWTPVPLLPCRTTGLLASVFVGCGLVSVALTAAFADKIRLFMYQDPLERPAVLAICSAIKFSFRDSRLRLTATLSIFIGLQQGFIHSDFSKWYVVCSLGVPYVSLVFVSMAALQAVAAFTLSLLMQHVARTLVIATGFVFHACLILVLLLWKPADDDSALLYVIAAAWGVCNAIWEMLNFATLLYVQPETTWQAAFAQSYFFRCIGLAFAFGMHDVVCTGVKLYALAVSLILAVVPLTLLELKIDHRRRKTGLSTL